MFFLFLFGSTQNFIHDFSIQKRILDAIIKYAWWYDLFTRISFHCRLYINHQLKLQSLIQRNYIKFFAAGFIVHNFHINFILILTGIDTVNFTICKADFICRRRIIPLCKLFCQCPDRAFQHSLHTLYKIFIPRWTVENRIAIVCNCLIHRLINILLSYFIFDFCPALSGVLQFSWVQFQCTVTHISKIHRLEIIFRPFFQTEPVCQKMCECADTEPLHSRYTICKIFSI